MRVPRLLPGTVLLLMLVPSAAASPGTLDLTSGVPVKLAGDVSATAGRAVLTALGSSGVFDLAADYESAQLRTIRVTTTYEVLAGERIVHEQTVEESAESLPGGKLLVRDRQSDFQFHTSGQDASLVAAGDPLASPDQVWRESNAQLAVLLRDKAFSPKLTRGLALAAAPSLPGPAALAAGWFEIKADAAEVRLAPAVLAASGATLRFESAGPPTERAARTETAQAPGSVWMPPVPPATVGSWTGPGTHPEDTLTYYLVELQGAHLTLQADEADVATYAETLAVHVAGHAGFPWARGTAEVKGAPRALSGEQVIAGGTLDLDAHQAQLGAVPAAGLRVSGDITFLQVGAQAEAFPVELVVAGAGTAVAAAGLAASLYYWPVLKWTLTGLVAPLYARLPKDRILDHKAREQVYERIKTEPGISTNRLARDFPFGWSTLTYHLRVLERNEAIVSVRDGRYKRFFDRESGKFANGRKFVVAVLKNDTTFAIGRLVLSHPGITQKEVGERFHLAPSSVHWHVERLLEAKLLVKQRDGHNVRYHPGPAWDEVHPEDLGVPTFGEPAPPAAPPDGPPTLAAAGFNTSPGVESRL